MHDSDECRNHVALSYIASLVTENETRLIHVDTLRKSVGLNIHLKSFDNADDVIYGSAIGKNATVVNAKQHSMHEFVRSGTNLEFIRPSKSQKLQSSRDQSEVATSSLSSLKPSSIDIKVMRAYVISPFTKNLPINLTIPIGVLTLLLKKMFPGFLIIMSISV